MRTTLAIVAVLTAALLSVGVAAAQTTLTATLSGGSGGDQDGTGYAVLTFSGTRVDYSILVQNIASPTAAHIHRSADNSVAIDLNVNFIGNLATGSVTASAAAVAAVLANPAAYYLNVHTGEFPTGAIRGTLTPTSDGTVVVLPVVATLKGQAGSNFKSDLVLGNQGNEPVQVIAEWYPTGQTLTGPAKTATLTVPAKGQLFTAEAPAALFQASGTRGGVILRSVAPFAAQVRTYNDQRAAGQGTFGQFVDGQSAAGAMSKGVMYGLSQGGAFRTNIGWFNPTTNPVTVTFTAYAADGVKLGEASATVPAYGNDIQAVFTLITGVANTAQPDFFVTYQASAPMFVFATVNDNTTSDGIHVAAKPLS
jgi:hypothetical protein